MQKVFFKTFGCRTNIFDTQIMINKIKDFEIVDNEKEADIIVVNSCTVTNSADSNIRNYINSIKDKKIFFTGCGVWTQGEKLFSENRVYALFGASEKEKINTLLKREKFIEKGNLEHIDNSIIERLVGKTKAFIKVQEGCDFRCNYCIIPFVRGDARSYKEENILKQVEILAQNGFSEFVLTGTNLGSYGKKNHTSIAKLLKKMSKLKNVKRIRLGSIEPIQIDDEFKEILDEPFMAKYLHIALQHTNKEMLKIMNRRNRVLDDLELFEFISSKNYAIGTDFIIGHPGETEERWQDAIENFKKFPLTHIHTFIYSPRDNTISATLKNNINGLVAKKRQKELEKIVKENNYKFRQNNKESLFVLVEQKKDNLFIGYDQFFNQVKIQSDNDLLSTWVNLDNYIVKDKYNFSKF